MRFTKEFKLKCVKKYQRGGYPPNPGGAIMIHSRA